jgi:hypothetical protein
MSMGRHRLAVMRRWDDPRRRSILLGALAVGLSAVLLATTLPLLARDDEAPLTLAATADTTATLVPQDGDNSVKTTLATCAAPCEGNPRGGREALLEFVVAGLPAGAVNVRARLQVFAWQKFDARISVHPASGGAGEARPPLVPPSATLDARAAVRKGYNEWDVSDLIRGNGTYTLALRQDGHHSRIYWASRENRNAGIRPRLLMSYDIGDAPSAPPAPTAPATTAVATTAAPAPTTASTTASRTVKASPSPKPTPSASGCGSVSELLVPSCGAWWGMYSPAGPANNWDHAGAVDAIEAQVGRKFDVIHRYHDFSNSGSNGAFPDKYELRQMREGRLLFFAWESRIFATGTTLRWADVYSGRYDATIDAVAGRIKAVGKPVFMGFDHEPEDEPQKGSDADFVRAWRYVHDRFNRAGAHNAVWVWTMMGWSGHYSRYAGLYPGDKYVDWVAYDPYNFYACNGSKTWKSPATTIGGFYRWLDENGIGAGKPRMLAEFGTNFDPADPTAKRRWFEEFPAAVKAHPKIKAVIYFNSAGSTTRSSDCDMTMNHDAESLAGFARAGRDPYFRQPVRSER